MKKLIPLVALVAFCVGCTAMRTANTAVYKTVDSVITATESLVTNSLAVARIPPAGAVDTARDTVK